MVTIEECYGTGKRLVYNQRLGELCIHGVSVIDVVVFEPLMLFLTGVWLVRMRQRLYAPKKTD